MMLKMLLDVHRNRRFIRAGQGAQDVHLDFHTAPELWGMNDDDDDEVMLNVLRCQLTY